VCREAFMTFTVCFLLKPSVARPKGLFLAVNYLRDNQDSFMERYYYASVGG
jgi:hypothetical protein